MAAPSSSSGITIPTRNITTGRTTTATTDMATATTATMTATSITRVTSIVIARRSCRPIVTGAAWPSAARTALSDATRSLVRGSQIARGRRPRRRGTTSSVGALTSTQFSVGGPHPAGPTTDPFPFAAPDEACARHPRRRVRAPRRITVSLLRRPPPVRPRGPAGLAATCRPGPQQRRRRRRVRRRRQPPLNQLAAHGDLV